MNRSGIQPPAMVSSGHAGFSVWTTHRRLRPAVAVLLAKVWEPPGRGFWLFATHYLASASASAALTMRTCAGRKKATR